MRRHIGWSLALLVGMSGCNPGGEPGPTQMGEPGAAPQGLTAPSGFSVTQVASGLSSPTAMAFAPDGRLFVCEQGGNLRVIKGGALLATPALTLSVNSAGERGLLGIAFDPSFASNGYIYLYYTATTPNIHNRLSRFTASGDTVSISSEVVLLDVDPLSGATNHNGGAIHFGPDGKLYIAVGDNATGSNAQTLSNMKGKILRMNRVGTIPNDNPFFYTATGNNRTIWALGLRNPFTFAFQPGTNRMFINDVGENTWEEINDGIAGSNYGWPSTEGTTSNPNYRSPLFSYGHGGGTSAGCSIAGGAFYNPTRVTFPSSYVGTYFFADYCGGWIRRMDPQNGNTVTVFATALSSPVDLQVASDGSLYTLERGGGVVNRIQYTASAVAPQITTHPQSVSVTQGATASFSVTATGTAPLSYQWQRNGSDIAGATSATYSLTTGANDNGATFRARVSNSAGAVFSNSATLTVAATANAAPVPVIQTPSSGSTYTAGTTLSFAGSATDAEDGTLPSSALSWRIDFHHDTHSHPFYPETAGISSGTATIPDRGETSANVFYRVYLTARDSAGRTATTSVDVRPLVTQLTLATNPAGLQLTLDGQPVASGITVDSVVGVIRAIGTTSPQTLNGTTYTWTSWSNSGAQTHEIATPATATTYTATFTASTPPAGSGTGTGLRGEYYDENNFTALAMTRIDSTVNFDWNISAPISSMGVENFSVRWTGFVEPRYSETYTFYTRSDDHVRLWVNNVLVVDNWTPHAETENSGTITLIADQKYDLRMEYRELTGNAVAKLYWSSPSQTREIIPRTRLYPPNP